MAGLLNQIAKQLLGTQKTVPVKTSHTKKTPVKVKPVERAKVEEWIPKSSTLEAEPSVELVIEELGAVEEQMEETEIAITAIDRTVKCERIQTDVEKDDYLLTQIDEFREKAQHLQELLLTKESKVNELQVIVDERELKARELEKILNERQRKADGISAEVSRQIDNLIEKVSAKMEEIGTAIGADLKDGQKLSEEQITQLRETLGSLTEQLDTIKGELSEKVHSENVKCYRNIADLFKGMDEKLDAAKEDNQTMINKVDGVRKCTVVVIVLSILNMLGLTVLALFELGVFQMFIK